MKVTIISSQELSTQGPAPNQHASAGQQYTFPILQQYDQFVHAQGPFGGAHSLGTIHQLYEWGLFQTKSAKRDQFWVVTVEEQHTGKILASALIIRQNLPFNKCWLYCPRGPLVDYSNPQITAALFAKIAELAHQQNAVFLRFDPAVEAEMQNAVPFHLIPNARPAHAHYQPESTLIVDLQPDPAAILAQMKPKGRYNIKVAQKHGVKIRCATAAPNATSASSAAPNSVAHATQATSDLQAFYDLLTQTTTRDQFSGHPLKYYQEILATLGPHQAKLYLAEYTPPAPAPHETPAPSHAPAHQHHAATQILAAAIVTYFNDTATYYFGASSNENRNTMAPYLLHWQIMQDAKTAGYKFYDLFGISPENPNDKSSTPHPWQSVTDFKLKFGGMRINYIPAAEIIYKPFWYACIRLTKAANRLIKYFRKN